METGSATRSPHGHSDDRITIAIVGSGQRATELLRLFADIDNVRVAAVCAMSDGSQSARLARDLSIYCTRDFTEIYQVPHLTLIIDASDDHKAYAQLQAESPSFVEVMGAVGAQIIYDLLRAKKKGEEQERLYVELQTAFEKIRQHERQLQLGKADLVRANQELETGLAEIYFTHEFFKAVAMYTAVEDVCSLVVDGCSGILGAEISAVYLLDRSTWTLSMRACQGRGASSFRVDIPVAETIVGHAFTNGAVQEEVADPDSESVQWMHGEALASQAAVPLKTGDEVFGVMVMASAMPRELSAAEMERLAVLGNQSSLALQNALLHEELELLSITDRLTDLFNHGHLQQRLDEEVNRSARFGHSIAVIMLDIDDFKAFNDAYGHTKGDEVLKGLSEVIRSCLRESDIAARYGGEEFALVLPETQIAGAVEVAERIRADFAALEFCSGGGECIGRTVSVGVAEYPRDGSTPTRMIEAADAAMYRAKRAGKNRVEAVG